MSLELFEQFYRKGSAEYKLAMHLHDYSESQDPGLGHDDLRILDDEDDVINYWFDGDEETAENFYTFAATSQSGLFAVWLLDGVPRPKMPIVFLGSEGDAHVIASSLADFVALLSLSVDELEWAFSQLDLDEDTAASKKLLQFRAFLETECKIKRPSDPPAQVKAAQAEHPSLKEFVEKWADEWSQKKK